MEYSDIQYSCHISADIIWNTQTYNTAAIYQLLSYGTHKHAIKLTYISCYHMEHAVIQYSCHISAVIIWNTQTYNTAAIYQLLSYETHKYTIRAVIDKHRGCTVEYRYKHSTPTDIYHLL